MDYTSLFIGCLFSVISVFFGTHRLWPSFTLFFWTIVVDLQFDSLGFLRRIRLDLVEDGIYTIAYLPFIWDVASHFLATTSAAALASAACCILLRYLLMREKSFKKSCFGYIFAVVCITIFQKVYDSYHPVTTNTENQFDSSLYCPPGSRRLFMIASD